jgi:hypothetical protein
MRRDVKILLTTAVLGAVAIGWPRAAEWMSGMDTFLIAEVDVRGLRYLSEEEVVGLLGVGPGTSVWGDPSVWADRVAIHPLVQKAEVKRRLPDVLQVEVTERIPVALAPTPALEPVDAEGYRLPLDPSAYRFDLPVLNTSQIPPTGARLVPEDVRRLAEEVWHLMSSDTAFLQRVSSVAWSDRGSMIVSWTDPPVDFLLHPGTSPARLREGLGALADAVIKTPERPPTVVDLRFVDQVVVRRSPGEGG